MQEDRKVSETMSLPASAGEVPNSVTFREILERRSRDRTLLKKERTRYLIFSIIAGAIQEDPTKKPTVEYVLERSALSRGTFYNHFTDIDNSIFEMLVTFFEYSDSLRMPRPRNVSRYEAILETNIWYCRMYEANANFFAAVYESPELGRVRALRNAEWARKVVLASERRSGRTYTDAEKIELQGVVRVLITMTIETLRERFVLKDAVISRAFPTAEQLGTALSVIWDRTMASYERDTEPA